MKIGNQYGVAYQPNTSDKSRVNQARVDAFDNVSPTSVRIGSDAIHSISKQGIKNQSHQSASQQSLVPELSPCQQTLPEFDFAIAASSGVNNQTVYDKPLGANRFAIDSYQQIINGPKREEIQRLVGIDTFA